MSCTVFRPLHGWKFTNSSFSYNIELAVGYFLFIIGLFFRFHFQQFESIYFYYLQYKRYKSLFTHSLSLLSSSKSSIEECMFSEWETDKFLWGEWGILGLLSIKINAFSVTLTLESELDLKLKEALKWWVLALFAWLKAEEFNTFWRLWNDDISNYEPMS